jgi:hypothetical protein
VSQRDDLIAALDNAIEARSQRHLVDPADLVKVHKAGALAGCTRYRILNAVARHELRSVEIDGSTFVFRSEVEAWVRPDFSVHSVRTTEALR